MTTDKILLLVRHAKSSWDEPGLADAERTLNKRGRRDAPRMGKRLANADHRPDLIVSSPAVRARATADAIAAEIGYPAADIAVVDSAYAASPRELMDIIRHFDDGYTCVMLVCHNPGITDLVNELTDEKVDNIPTCGVATLALDTPNWQKAGEATARLLDFDYPKKAAA